MNKAFKFFIVTITVFIVVAVFITFKIEAARSSNNTNIKNLITKNNLVSEVTNKIPETTCPETEPIIEINTTQPVETIDTTSKETTCIFDDKNTTPKTTTVPKIEETTSNAKPDANVTTQPTLKEELTFPIAYSDSTCEITIYKEWFKNAWCYAAHIKFTDFSRLGTECANGCYNKGYETTSHCAKRLNSILTVNGCYSAPYLNYTVIRNGIIYNGADRNLCLPAIYSNKTGLLLSVWETGGTQGIVNRNVTELVNEGMVTDTFCFGPPNLQNGIISGINDGARAQRTFLGTNGIAGDIWIVVSDGRYNDGVSAGLTGYETAEFLVSKGCIFGVNLDGGGSSTMCFNGEILNANKNNERAVVDFLWFK